jgi:glutamyl-Q tRNA(Asp) synthetase
MAGRFAPSPTGPLHFGSLLTATASYLEAHTRNVPWRLRFDDLDAPRSIAGAEDAIKQALEAHGLHWEGPVSYQSQHADAYAHALSQLAKMDMLFYCTCSRRELKNFSSYPGTCRAHRMHRANAAIRVAVADYRVEFDDAVQGTQRCSLAASVGDFIVRRRDGLIAYQLATAVDDGDADIDHVVRGADLLDNTPRQLFLIESLGLSAPSYAHVPLITHADGAKLSKQTGAPAVTASQAPGNLLNALRMLGTPAPAAALHWSCEDILQWAKGAWDLRKVPKVPSLIGRN